MYTLDISDYGLFTARETEAKADRSFILTHGLNGENTGVDPFVSVSIHGRGANGGPGLYAGLYLTPDEARGLAARLLDAADDAQENLDAPVEYTLTGKR